VQQWHSEGEGLTHAGARLADEVIAGRGNGERWDTPRCITPAQLARLRRLMNETTYTQIASR
jgi:hypothetical protein